MVCFAPNQGFEKIGFTKTGGFGFTRSIKSARRVNGVAVEMQTPCRRCEGCRNDNAKEWAIKVSHEADMHYIPGVGFNTCFITLTYNDDSMPLYGGLDYSGDLTDFIKRLRKNIRSHTYMRKFGLKPVFNKIRYFLVGEYGSINWRPHYHVILFGYNFPDRYLFDSNDGNPLYRSPFLESLWSVPQRCNKRPLHIGKSLGYSSIGDVTFGSAAYVARYNLNKLIGNDLIKDEFDCFIDSETGLYVSGKYHRWNMLTGDKIIVESERNLHSNKPGIARAWIERNWTDFYPKDHLHLPNGIIVRPPKFYDKVLSEIKPELLEQIKKARQDFRTTHADEFTPKKLADRRALFKARMDKHQRKLGRIYDT